MSLYDNWYEEMRSTYLYAIMAQHENNVLHRKLFLDLQVAAEKQAKLWEEQIKLAGEPIPKAFQPNLRTRLIAWLIKRLGTENLHPMLSAMKIRGMSLFTRFHTEHKHSSFTSANNLRAAIFGVNDGLLSNMSLILGITGANMSGHFVLITGIAGLLAGASSMAAGEYISVRSQREVFERQIAIEKQELEEYPEEEMEELSLIYEARGLPAKEAAELAKLMINNPATGLDTLAREELGLNPDELVSPTGAMLSSFVSFAIGACIPLLPFCFPLATWTIWLSISATGITLFCIGAMLSLFTNRSACLLGLRMLSIGILAGAATYLIGRLLGVSV